MIAPLTGTAPSPGRDAIRYRTVSVTGNYLDSTGFLGGQTLSDTGGYYAISPLRTDAGIVLVVRGFVADLNGHPGEVAAPPTGTVHLTGRLDTTDSQGVANPADQAKTLGRPVYQALLKLLPKQPGGAGLDAFPSPDLSNPAGGAYEGQHFAYIVQWYFFALLALTAPFLLARNEVREAQRKFLGLDTGELELGTELDAAGLAALGAGAPDSDGAQIAVRGSGTIARTSDVKPADLARAKRLADRYGRSLSLGTDVPSGPARPPRRHAPSPVGGLTEKVPNSADAPHRSHDSYQGSYNDYLWQLGLADGAVTAPDIDVEPPASVESPPAQPAIQPVVIDVDVEP